MFLIPNLPLCIYHANEMLKCQYIFVILTFIYDKYSCSVEVSMELFYNSRPGLRFLYSLCLTVYYDYIHLSMVVISIIHSQWYFDAS